MAACPTCKKFTSIDASTDLDPADIEIDDAGVVTGTIRMVNCCSECGEEVRETVFDVELAVNDYKVHLETCEEAKKEEALAPSVELLDLERDEQERPPRAKRRAKFYIARGTIKVTCECGSEFFGYWQDEMKSSLMETM